MMLSRELITRIKLDTRPAYRIAQQADIHPTTLSKLMNGIEVPKPDDPRVLAVGRVVGLKKNEVFEKK